MKRSNTITAVFFLVFLAAMALLTCLGLPSIWTDLVQGWQNQEDPSDRSLIAKAVYVTEHTEAALNETLDGSHLFIQLYGGVQRLAGRRMVADVSSDNTVIKLSTGALTFCGLDNQYTAPTLQAERTAALAQYVESLGASFLAAVAPEKIPPEGGQLPGRGQRVRQRLRRCLPAPDRPSRSGHPGPAPRLFGVRPLGGPVLCH